MGGMRRALSLLVVALALTACKVDSTVTVEVEADGSGVITLTARALPAFLPLGEPWRDLGERLRRIGEEPVT